MSQEDAIRKMDKLRNAWQEARLMQRLNTSSRIDDIRDALTEVQSLYEKWLDVRIGAAGNERTSQAALAWLAQDEESSVRCEVADNRSTDIKTLRALMRDKDPAVRARVAINEVCTEDMLERLSEDDNAIVRNNVAINEHAPHHVLCKLSVDRSADVRYAAKAMRRTRLCRRKIDAETAKEVEAQRRMRGET